MKAKFQEALKEAMKARDKVRLETIRAVISAIGYEEIAKGNENLPQESYFAVVRSEIKKRQEQIEFAEKGNRPELKTQCLAEIKVLEGFLPSQMSAADLEKVILQMKQENPAANMGLVMKGLKERFSGQYDSKMASEIAKRIAG